ncbi:DUF4097 family beta strand repeat-containing protein [Sporosarcina sp. CAU 1771]
MRRNRSLRLSDLAVVLIIFVILLVIAIKFISGVKGTTSYEAFASAENTTHVFIVSDIADVNVSMYEGDEIRAYLSDKEGEHLFRGYKLKVKEKGGKVTINAKRKSKHAESYAITVELPSKQYEQLQIQADAANIFVGPIHTSGYVLKTSVGNIDVESGQGIINADTQVGNVQIKMQTIVRDLVVKTEVGNIAVETNEAPQALQTVCKTTIGEVTISLPNVQNGIIGTGGPLVKLISEVGDVSLSLTGE